MSFGEMANLYATSLVLLLLLKIGLDLRRLLYEVLDKCKR